MTSERTEMFFCKLVQSWYYYYHPKYLIYYVQCQSLMNHENIFFFTLKKLNLQYALWNRTTMHFLFRLYKFVFIFQSCLDFKFSVTDEPVFVIVWDVFINKNVFKANVSWIMYPYDSMCKQAVWAINSHPPVWNSSKFRGNDLLHGSFNFHELFTDSCCNL